MIIAIRAKRVLRATFSAPTVAMLFVGCRPHPAPPPPVRVVEQPKPLPPISPWPGTLSSAMHAAESGKFDEADRVLVEFSVKHANSAEGAESDFWRAMLKLDPANAKVSTREQLALLDAYLDIGSAAPRYAEVQILRRMVEASDSTRALMGTIKLNADARAKRMEEEMHRLQELNDRTAAELERIKRRLAPKQP